MNTLFGFISIMGIIVLLCLWPRFTIWIVILGFIGLNLGGCAAPGAPGATFGAAYSQCIGGVSELGGGPQAQFGICR